jgi:hypothetical protein
MGVRNDEALANAERLQQVIRRLQEISDVEEPPDYAALARQLFPVARMFESLGFLSVAREIAYVEKALEDLAPRQSVGQQGPAPLTRIEGRPVGEAELDIGVRDEGREESRLDRRPRVPAPMVVMFVLLVAVVAASVVFVTRSERVPERLSSEPVLTPPPPTVTAPSSTPTPRQVEGEDEDAPTDTGARLAREIAQARRAMADGDLDLAISHLSAAALADFDSSLVLDTAQAVVNRLIDQSNQAAGDGEWERAAELLERARQLSLRFGFPLEVIDHHAARHAAMERFRRLDPTQLQSIRAEKGKRVRLVYRDGRTREGRIHGVSGQLLELDRYTEIGSTGNRLYYVEEVPLAALEELRVYDD